MLSELDGDILIYIQEHIRNSAFNMFFPKITLLGNAGIFWILLTLVLLAVPKTRKAGICSAIALIFSGILNNLLLKPIVNRTRPYEIVEGLRLIGKKPIDASFPSGHTAASFASATALSRYIPKKYSVALFVLALFIAFSRLYIGVHYPTDVLFGLADGIVLGLLAIKCMPLLEKYREKRKNS